MRVIDVNEILSAFSLALDLAENKKFEHAQRTAYIALTLAREMGTPREQLRDIYASALLHDIGMVNALAEAEADLKLLENHCMAGRDVVSTLPLSPQVSEYILWHHANWDGNGPFELSGKEIPLGSQIVYLADQLDYHMVSMTDSQTERHNVIDYIKSAAGKRFSPEIVEAFLMVQEKEVFWLDYNHYHMSDVLSRIAPANEIMIDIEGIESIALTFARIIDNKSPFTHEHSQGVSTLLSLLGQDYRYDEETSRKLRISGLLHDLGKLAIPNTILDKPGSLTPLEFQLIKSHTYYTKIILSKVKEFAIIKEWAANHHETLDGKGYPEGLAGEQLSKQERMVALCDVYQALTEERPYRKPMAQSKVYEIIGDMVHKGKLCADTFADLKRIMS